MSSVTFTYTTIVKAPLHEVWSFFSTASNLAKITTFPKVTIDSNPETEEGNELTLNLSIVGITFNWVSYIEKVEQPHYFIDTGIKLPYPFKSWTHEHRFSDNGNETVMTDSIECRASVPDVIVKIILTRMFKSREKKLASFFARSIK